MTQFRKGEDDVFDAEDGAEPADPTAFAAAGASLPIHLGNRKADGPAIPPGRLQKQMTVRLLDVTIQELHRLATAGNAYGQISGQGGLSGASFSRGDSDDHLPDPLTVKHKIRILMVASEALESAYEHVYFQLAPPSKSLAPFFLSGPLGL
jgi:hypothetical protein